MKVKLFSALCLGSLLAMGTTSYADFNFINHTGDNLLIQPCKTWLQEL
jgi:hypothetical protein